jgi:PAS domain S-box-containing protein
VRELDAIGEEPSPLESIPGLADLARVIADAVTVTDLHRRVVLWNQAAEDLYGIAARDAVGVPIDLLYDSTIIGAGTSSSGARTIALDVGTWRGRVADRPRIGRFVGQELVIETVLSRLTDASGPIGVISIKRDVTASVRVERELSTLSSLATVTGEARSRVTFAQRALDVLSSVMQADHGGIAVSDEQAGRLIARRNMTPVMEELASVPWAEAPAIRAVTPTGRVVKGPIDRLPLAPTTRRALLRSGVRTLLVVGLHREEELVGILTLGWDRDDPVIPSDAVILLLATIVARGLENARLVEEILRRADAERSSALRLRALDELTRVGGNVGTIDELAERSARLINMALGAEGTAYGLFTPEGDGYSTFSLTEVPPDIDAWLRSHSPHGRSGLGRWHAGEGAYVEALAPGVVPMEYVELARRSGLTAYAAIPIRIDEAVVGGIVAYFDRRLADLHADRAAIDRVATIASISLANFRLRERLESSERRYYTLFEQSPDALILERLDGSVLEVNEAAIRTYGAPREWLIGRQSRELAIFDVEPARVRAEGLMPGESYRVRSTGIGRDGNRFPQEIDVTRLDLDGEPRLLVRIRDLTDQERLQTELIQAQKMEATGQLVSGVAHELNNPLASILGFSQLIRRDPSLPEELRHDADLLIEEAARTRRIVQNLLDFARQRPPERHRTAIRGLIDSVVALQSYSLGAGLIEVDVDVPDGLPAVELDRGQLQQVLVNLTHNAIYAIKTGGGGRIRISASTEGPADVPRVRLTVMDDGPGVEPEHVDRLFEAFFTTKPPSDGTGLGLSVSYGIVAAHGGELRYGPSAWGRGAAFTFDLPVRAVTPEGRPVAASVRSAAPDQHAVPAEPHAADPPATPPSPGERQPAASSPATELGRQVPRSARGSTVRSGALPISRRRVLVLDDEPAIRILLERALRSAGFEPVITASAAEAIERAMDGEYAALLVDHKMPDMSGIDVFRRVVARRPEIARRFVIISGEVVNPTLESFAGSHGVALLAKPFDLDDLERVVRERDEASEPTA